MATIKRFEDLISWQRARELVKYIYYLTKKSAFQNDRGLKTQIERSAVSSMANQAEGFSRGTKLELINYFFIAKGSAGETQSHLYVALDQNYITKEEFNKAYGLADEVQRLIQHFVDRVKGGARSGIQYKRASSNIAKEWEDYLEKEQGLIKSEDGHYAKKEE